mgnify:FL=1
MNVKKSILFYDMVYIVERNGAMNKMLQPKVDDFDFWFIFLWKSQYF